MTDNRKTGDGKAGQGSDAKLGLHIKDDLDVIEVVPVLKNKVPSTEVPAGGFEDLTLEAVDEDGDVSTPSDAGNRDQAVVGEANLPVRAEGAGGGELRAYSGNMVEEAVDTKRLKGRMGDKMVSMGLITEDQLNVGLQEKKVSNKMLGEIFVELGFINEVELTAFLSESSGFELFDPKNTIVDGDVLALIEKEVALKYNILPLSRSI